MGDQWTDTHFELYETLLFFHENYECPKCLTKSAFYLEGCDNPLHILHDNLYRMENEKPK